MNIYKKIKDIGKKIGRNILVVGGLCTLLSGCGDTIIEYKTTQIFKDLNGDGKPENITLKLKGYTDKKNSYLTQNSGYWKNDHEVFSLDVSNALGNGKFGKPQEAYLFHGKPEEIRIEDITEDGQPDLIFLKLKGYTDKKNSYLTQNSGYWKNDHEVFSLMIAKGKSDGSFEEPFESLVFHGKPEGMY